MARPKSFDTEKVLDAAIDCFWREGLKSASTRDLASRMGIAGPSLYNAFGCKRELFGKALDRYAECIMRPGLAALEAEHGPAGAIAAFIRRAIDKALGSAEPANCLILNTAMEVGPDDGALGGQIADYLDEVAAFFKRNLVAAKECGEIPADTNADEAARMLLAVTLGIAVLARCRPDRTLLEGAARPALASLTIQLTHNERGMG
ncbi:MAG: TetR/AcrR family transcriptional regulator [Rhodomicrobiaceae bacterium]